MDRSRGCRSAAAALVALAALTACGGPSGRASWTAAPAAASPSESPVSAPPVAEPVSSPSPSPTPKVPTVALPAGVTAGIVVYDRTTHAVTVQRNASQRFRSASLVKLLIALDELWNRGPGYTVPPADRAGWT